MKKFLWTFTLMILLSSYILSGCQKKPAGTINYGGQYYPEEFLLKGKPDLWEKYDVVVNHTLFSSGTENDQALLSGEIDINIGSDSKTVALFNAIPDEALILAASQRGDRYSTIVKIDSPYTSWHDLKGKVVATRLGSGAEQVLRRYFEMEEDLAWEDYEWVNLKVEDMTSALADGSIEAFTAWEPTPAIAEANGVGKVIRSYGDIAKVPVFIHTTKLFAETHHDEIVRFLAAHLDKAEMIKNDPQKAAEIAAQTASAQGSDVSAETFVKVFQRVDFSMDLDADVLASLADTAQFLKDAGEIDAIPEFRYDSSFLEEAKKLQGK